MPRWAAIVRVSHVGVRGGETFHADEDQVADIRRYADLHKATVDFLEPELSVSGGRPIDERPSLKRAIEGVERGDYDGIVVAYLSRLTRSRSGIEIWDRVEKVGGHVHCAAENLDTSTPNGRFIRDIHLANAVREREEHAERHARRKIKTVEAGVWMRRQLPRGYAFKGPADEDGRYRGKARRLVPGPDAGEVRAAFRDRAAGNTPVTAIAKRLGMTPSGARALLRNRVYLGELRDGDTVNPAAHEPLVTLDVFQAAQRSVSRPARSKGAPALLAGLVRCAGCGHVMSRAASGNVPVYACPRTHSGRHCPEPAAITCRLLDPFVEPIALRELGQLATHAGSGADVQHAQAQLAHTEAELRAYVEAVSPIDVGADTFSAGARARKAAVDEARTALERELARGGAPILGDVEPAALWEKLDGHERNTVLRGLLAAVIVRRAGGRGRQVPLVERVRVVAAGADIAIPQRRRGHATGIVPLPLPDLDAPGVLRPLRVQNAL